MRTGPLPMIVDRSSAPEAQPEAQLEAQLEAPGRRAVLRLGGALALGAMMASLPVGPFSRALAQSRSPRNRAVNDAIFTVGAALDTMDGMKVFIGNIKNLAQRAATDAAGAANLEQQAASLAEQIDILTGDLALGSANLIGKGAQPWTKNLVGERYTVSARDLSSGALGLTDFDFQSAAGRNRAVANADKALGTIGKLSGTYKADINRLKKKRVPEPPPPPSAATGGVAQPSTGGGSNALIDQIMNQLKTGQ